MYYIIYKITNKINGKFYIGMHKTTNLNDGYMGSGKLIRAAIKKYGLENFIKEILHVFENEEDMKNKEKKLVVLNEMSYNLCEGGKGGFGYINQNKLNSGITNENSRKNLKRGSNPYKNTLQHYKNLSTILKEKYPSGVWKNRKHSTKTIEKLKNHKRQIGINNSQYGTCWVTNGQENKKIKKEELDIWLGKGYSKGRIKR